MSKLNLLQSETLKKYLFCLVHYLLFFLAVSYKADQNRLHKCIHQAQDSSASKVLFMWTTEISQLRELFVQVVKNCIELFKSESQSWPKDQTDQG